jgi:hypothetical protein
LPVPVAEGAQVKAPRPIVHRLFVDKDATLVGFVDPFVLLDLEMLHLDEQDIPIAGKVREFSELGLFVLLVVQRPAAKIVHHETSECGWQIGRPAGSFNMNGHVTDL